MLFPTQCRESEDATTCVTDCKTGGVCGVELLYTLLVDPITPKCVLLAPVVSVWYLQRLYTVLVCIHTHATRETSLHVHSDMGTNYFNNTFINRFVCLYLRQVP